jgi:hypothetical protein
MYGIDSNKPLYGTVLCSGTAASNSLFCWLLDQNPRAHPLLLWRKYPFFDFDPCFPRGQLSWRSPIWTVEFVCASLIRITFIVVHRLPSSAMWFGASVGMASISIL